MKSLLQKPAHLLAAFAVATLGMGAPAALANDTQADTTTQNVAYAQQYASLSRDEAKALSAPQVEGGAGSVVLFVGEGFNQRVLNTIERQLSERNINVEIVTGGDVPDHLQVFINNDELKQNDQPAYLDAATADKYLVVVLTRMIDEKNINVFANADIDSPSNEPA